MSSKVRVNQDLQRERDCANFNLEQLTYIFDGSREYTQKRRYVGAFDRCLCCCRAIIILGARAKGVTVAGVRHCGGVICTRYLIQNMQMECCSRAHVHVVSGGFLHQTA